MDNGFSRHVSRDRSTFLTWKPVEKANINFGNSEPDKTIVKGVVSLSNGRGKAKNVLYVGGLMYNMLSVSQMSDQGYDVIFKAKNCHIKSIGTSEIVVEVMRT